MKHKGIIDRFEGIWAVVEFDTEIHEVSRSILPQEAEVGDVVWFDEDSGYTLDKGATEKRKQEIETLMDDLWEE